MPISISIAQKGFENIFLPIENGKEANLCDKLKVYTPQTLRELTDHLTKTKKLTPLEKPNFWENFFADPQEEQEFDFAYIKGQEICKRALEIAVSAATTFCFLVRLDQAKPFSLAPFPLLCRQ